MIPRIVAGTYYVIPLDPEVFDIIIYIDMNNKDFHDTLYNRMETIEGVWGVDYNIFMGDNIFFSIADEFDTGETWDSIGDLITEYVRDGYVL